jgi:mRNA-degrading endonuclease YafQ of YafQ-DinJ toxin-antitoxin module
MKKFKKLVILTLCVCYYSATFSQDLLKEIQKLTLANDSLQKQIIKPLHDSILSLNTANAAEASKVKALEKEKDGLNKKIKKFEKDVADLNKNKVKIERDTLQKQVERLTANDAELNQRISEKDRQILDEKQRGEQTAKQE